MLATPTALDLPRRIAARGGKALGTRVVVAFSWADREGRRHRWAHALALEDDRIVDLQDYASSTRAAAATRLRAVFG